MLYPLVINAFTEHSLYIGCAKMSISRVSKLATSVLLFSATASLPTHFCLCESRNKSCYRNISYYIGNSISPGKRGEVPMKVDIWSDVACPWCYIGKRRIEKALAEFEHGDQVEIIWHSYQLDPDAPAVSHQTIAEVLAQKYGRSLAQAAAMNERVSGIAAQDGLEYHMEKVRYGNTFDAHRLIHLAATHHLQDAMEERFFRAYFTEGAALGDSATLVKLAGEIGL